MRLDPRQKLVEQWEVTFTRREYSRSPLPMHTASIFLPHPVIIATVGRGYTVEAARVDAIVKTATGYIDCTMEGDEDWAVSDESLAEIIKVARREQNRRRKLANSKQKGDSNA